MRIQVGSKSSADIQLDTGTVQGSALSPLLFDLLINAILRLIDSTGIFHRVRGVPDWNHQVFADDLSLYVSSTEDANNLLDIVSEFQEWSGLKISIKKSLATGALYGKGETQRQKDASAESRKRKAPVLPQYTFKAVLQETKSQRCKVIDTAIEVAAYLYKNDNLRIDQRLKVISMCLPLFSPSQHHSSTGLNSTSRFSSPYGSEHIRTPGA